jgi:hypothetical protein
LQTAAGAAAAATLLQSNPAVAAVSAVQLLPVKVVAVADDCMSDKQRQHCSLTA